MNDSQITNKIDQAKDQFGVIPSESAQSQLGSLTEADWQQASHLFAPDPTKPDGFSIVYKPGIVTIHNDTSEAKKIGNTSVSDLTGADANTVFNDTLDVVGAGAVVAGLAAGIGEASAAGVLSGETLGAAFMAASGTMAIGGVGMIVGSGVFLAGDMVRNVIRQGEAEHDVINNSVIYLQGPAPAVS